MNVSVSVDGGDCGSARAGKGIGSTSNGHLPLGRRAVERAGSGTNVGIFPLVGLYGMEPVGLTFIMYPLG